jgi:hypothetical protein
MSGRREEDLYQQELMLIGHKQDNEDRLQRERLALFIQQQEHHDRPSTKHQPRLSIDGNMWCALFGEDLMNGVAGFGKSPAEAYAEFDKAWTTKLPERAK